jgi:hypothetical protein
MNLPRTARLAVVLASLAIPVAAAGALAAAPRKKSVTKTCSVPAGATRTCDLRYPVVKSARAEHAGFARLLLAPKLRRGEHQPDLRKVKFISTRSVRHGTILRVKVRNGNGATTAAARVRLRATTTY